MTVNLSVHNTFTKQALIDLASRGDVAVCPMVALKAKSFRYKRQRIGLHYGADCGRPAPGKISGQPICELTTPDPLEEDMMFIGLGQSYLTSNPTVTFDNSCDVSWQNCSTNLPATCNSRRGFDILPSNTLSPPTTCNGKGTGHFSQWYEVLLRDIAAATQPAFDASARSGINSGTLSFVDVLVFSEINVPGFACPTGIDVLFRGVEPAVANVQRFRLPLGSAVTQHWARQ